MKSSYRLLCWHQQKHRSQSWQQGAEQVSEEADPRWWWGWRQRPDQQWDVPEGGAAFLLQEALQRSLWEAEPGWVISPVVSDTPIPDMSPLAPSAHTMCPTNTDILASLAHSLLNCGEHEEALRWALSVLSWLQGWLCSAGVQRRCCDRILAPVKLSWQKLSLSTTLATSSTAWCCSSGNNHFHIKYVLTHIWRY